MEFDLAWVHMARYELILKLDGALSPDHKMAHKHKRYPQISKLVGVALG